MPHNSGSGALRRRFGGKTLGIFLTARRQRAARIDFGPDRITVVHEKQMHWAPGDTLTANMG
jgi:hypothetical protein